MKHKAFLRNVAVISAGGLIAKAIGAFYRIFLVGDLGGYGMGLYQMTYPLFCLILTFSSAGIPSAISRMIANETARGRRDGQTLSAALRLFAVMGACGTALMCLFAPVMSNLQGDNSLVRCYLALAPSVFFVSLIAVLRGYFQGKSDMTPTAMSEIVEQLVKTFFGLYFAAKYAGEVRAVVGTLFAVSISEAVALFLLFARYGMRKTRRPALLAVRRTHGSDVLRSVFPVMAAAAILPLSQTVDSVLIVRLLPHATARSVELYGLFSGGAAALVNLPATVCYGLAAASVPAVSSYLARGDEEGSRRSAVYAVLLTFVLSLCGALVLFFFANPIVGLLYRSLSAENKGLLVTLVRITCVSSVTLSGIDTLAACLTGMGKAHRAAWCMLVAVGVKTALECVLVPAFSVYGAAISLNLCYLIAFSLDLFYTVRKSGRGQHGNGYRFGRKGGRCIDGGACRDEEGGRRPREELVARIGRARRRRREV